MAIKDSNITINVKDLDHFHFILSIDWFHRKKSLGNQYAQLAVPGLLIGLHPLKETKQ